jgi:lysophospholipase L1-like esterase
MITRIVAALLAMAMTAVGAGAQSTPEVPEALRGIHRIVCLGDSITQAGEAPGGYVWLIRKTLSALYPNMEVINAGISGHKSTDMLARFDRDVLAPKPDLVTISVGVNDVWHGFYDNHPMGDGPRGVPLPEYRKNVEAMVAKAKAANVKVVILSTTVINEDLTNRENAKLVGYNAALRDIAHKDGLLFIDLQRPFQALIKTYRATTGGRDNLLTVDGVHMNPEGNKVMAHTILSGLGVSPEARQQAKL